MAETKPSLPTIPQSDYQLQNKHRQAIKDLVVELVIALEDEEVILKRKGIDKEAFEHIKKTPYFIKEYGSFLEEWHSAQNTKQRTALESSYLLSKLIPVYFARAVNPEEPLNHVNDAVRNLARIAGMDSGSGGNTDRFTISINLGEGQVITQDVKTIEGKTEK